ncbi:putative epidermal cell surface receptor isoform X3 [Vanessa tameamea]|uniref:Epidermal cell surface receptor isoform X3 n=1 Tax=Vanessa tameamea TaxID=334116 RepID=A0A8B8I0P6_VANTA
MARGACALALLCVITAGAVAYTVDCNHEYTDCDTELRKLTSEDDDSASTLPSILPTVVEIVSPKITTTTTAPTRSTLTEDENRSNKTEVQTTTEANEVPESAAKPKPRLLNLSVDELQNFANILHNQTKGIKSTFSDLSDVNLDEDEDENPRLRGDEPKNTHITDKFFSNLKAPFNPLLSVDRSEETETCKENDITYKIGEHVDRGCEESCECTPGGSFECAPRCQHPYIRRGRRLTDPLCFESPVDECCSIIACATGNGDPKLSTLEVCRYGNVSYPVGGKWNIGCEQTCTCEQNSVVTCKPRCKRLPQSDKCINVQDPNDECCEMQICDVSQDVHEEPAENITSSTSPTIEIPKQLQDSINLPISPMRPLVLSEPIGSIKVLQNNSVQVNLMHMNSSDDPVHLLISGDGGKTYSDVELKYSNLILNLEGGKDYVLKTKETGTKFNFTITALDVGNEVEEPLNGTNVGCYHDGQFYAIGDEFQIGCSELCECTGPDSRECAPLLCPSHVGLELVSKGCVRWAPNPPPTPPNCCPRTARCLSDGTCHYKGVAIPNWSEVPVTLTGCEENCFCENGELDCEVACAPLPPIPPQNLRCPPMHRPAPVNISDEDCCKQWGCVAHAGNMNTSTFQTYAKPTYEQTVMNYVTPVVPAIPAVTTSYLPTPPRTTELYRRLSPIKSNFPIFFKTIVPHISHNDNFTYVSEKLPNHILGNNITVFTPEDIDSPFKTIQPEPPSVTINDDSDETSHSKSPVLSNHYKNTHLSNTVSMSTLNSVNQNPLNIIISDGKLLDVIQNVRNSNSGQLNVSNDHDLFIKQIYDNHSVKKVSQSQINHLNYFLPSHDKKTNQAYFEPKVKIRNKTIDRYTPQDPLTIPSNQKDHLNHIIHNSLEKHVTHMTYKDLKTSETSDFESPLWRKHTENHLLTKEPNPYETVLLRILPNAKPEKKLAFDTPSKSIPRVPTKTYSSLDLEHILNQMELESEVNRNLGRSADKSRGTIALGQ